MSADMKTAEITLASLLDMQVCVPKDATDQQAEEFANDNNPTGIKSRWTMKKNGDSTLAGDPERVPCEERPGHVHIMLQC